MIARREALADAFDALSRARGHGEYKPVSKALQRSAHVISGEDADADVPECRTTQKLHRYLADVEFECVQELFAQIAQWRPLVDDAWRAWPPYASSSDAAAIQETLMLLATFDLAHPETPPMVEVRIAQSEHSLSAGGVHLARIIGGSAPAMQCAVPNAISAYRRTFARLHQHSSATAPDELLQTLNVSERAFKRLQGGRPVLFLSVAYVGDIVSALTSARLLRRPERFGGRLILGEESLKLLKAIAFGSPQASLWAPPREFEAAERHISLNSSQHGALEGLAHNIELICGPPATGKSATILALVTECLGDTASIVTAVQNRAIEALVSKFASSATVFITAGSRLTGESQEYTLQKQVERDADVKAVQMTLRRDRLRCR
jgi:hypothetical protein